MGIYKRLDDTGLKRVFEKLKAYVDSKIGGAALKVQTAATAGQVTNAEVTDGDNRLKFERAGDVMQMDIDDGTAQNTMFLAGQSYVDAKAGTHFQVGVERWYGTYTDENGVTYQTYSKTVYIPALPSTPGITTYEHGIANIKQVLDIYGSTTDGFVLNAPRQTVADNITIYQASRSASNRTFSIEVGKDRSSKKAYVTVIYAKNN